MPALRAEGAARSAQWARDQLADCAGYWVHVDVDVLDPAVMPAVDAPDPGGIAFAELEMLLAGLVDTPHCLGVEITVFDPDYDPDGAYAAEIVDDARGRPGPGPPGRRRAPDLVAARRRPAGPPPTAPRRARRPRARPAAERPTAAGGPTGSSGRGRAEPARGAVGRDAARPDGRAACRGGDRCSAGLAARTARSRRAGRRPAAVDEPARSRPAGRGARRPRPVPPDPAPGRR